MYLYIYIHHTCIYIPIYTLLVLSLSVFYIYKIVSCKAMILLKTFVIFIAARVFKLVMLYKHHAYIERTNTDNYIIRFFYLTLLN